MVTLFVFECFLKQALMVPEVPCFAHESGLFSFSTVAFSYLIALFSILDLSPACLMGVLKGIEPLHCLCELCMFSVKYNDLLVIGLLLLSTTHRGISGGISVEIKGHQC